MHTVYTDCNPEWCFPSDSKKAKIEDEIDGKTIIF